MTTAASTAPVAASGGWFDYASSLLPGAPAPASSPAPGASLVPSLGIADQLAGWLGVPSAEDLKVRIVLAARERGFDVRVGAVRGGLGQPLAVESIAVLDASGKARATIERAEVEAIWPLKVTLRGVSASLGDVALAVPAASLAFSPATEPEAYDVRLSAASVRIDGARSVTLTGFSATTCVAGSAGIAGALAPVSFDARGLGGRIAGKLTPAGWTAPSKRPVKAPTGAPRFFLSLSGVTFGGGHPVDATLEGAVPRGLADLRASGRATVHGLSVNLTNDPQLAQLESTARSGGEASRLLGSLVHDRKIRNLAGSMAGDADYWHTVVASLRRRHSLGSAGGPLTVANGVATISPFSGANISGRVSVNLASRALSGYLSRVRLGRVAAGGVSLSGTTGAPRHSIDRSKITLDGKRLSSAAGPSAKVRTDAAELMRGSAGRFFDAFLNGRRGR